MDFDLADEQKMIQAMSRKFAREVIAPRWKRWKLPGNIPMT